MDRITLAGMRFEGRHGVSEEERLLPQLLEVDLEVEADLGPASRSDALADTTDYGPLIEAARRTVEEDSYRLLEALAGSLADAVLRVAPAAAAVTVRVRKLAVPVEVDMDHAQVELRREQRRQDAPGTG
jgi:7,8-dihydroneopterin aldolase/epimerase/oxygenase